MELAYFTSKIKRGEDLTEVETVSCFDALQAENDESAISNLLTVWAEKRAGVDEMYALAYTLRSRCKKVSSKHRVFIDVVGTGGSKSKTFNVSTAAAFVIAGAGLPVAKHGNRAATSLSGSADVLTELGVDLEAASARAEACLDEIGICFMFAPHFHSLSPTLAKVRRQLGFPTIFNAIGPLCNPAGAPFQLIGAGTSEMQKAIEQVLLRLGTTKSWVVHGDGLDEISVSHTTSVSEISSNNISHFEITPNDFGIDARRTKEPKGMSARESAMLIIQILSNESVNNFASDVVLINAAAAICIAGHSRSKKEAAEIALESLRSGNALRKLNKLRQRTA